MKKTTPIESAGRALVNWAIEQQCMRELARSRHGNGLVVFHAPPRRMNVEKEKTN